MKTMRVLLFGIMIMAAASHAFAIGSEFNGKAGAARAHEPDKFGLDGSLQYMIVPDPYFATGPEMGMAWFKWDRSIGSTNELGLPGHVKADTNAYFFPMMWNAQIRLYNLLESIRIMPYLTGGIGYGCMWLHYSEPRVYPYTVYNGDSTTRFYQGFVWQILAGIAAKPGQDSNIRFFLEAGYRGARVKRGSTEINMSGFLAHLGASFPIGN